MRFLRSFLWASCLSHAVLAARSHFDHGLIVEYEDWASENNAALIQDIKAKVNSSHHVDVVDVKTRLEISSPIFRGFSFNVTGEGQNVTSESVQAKIQSLLVVKKVSPIRVLHTLSPVNRVSYRIPEIQDNEVSSNTEFGVFARRNGPELSTHVMTGVDKLHAAGIKGKGVKIAIMDTGFDYKQAALGNSIGPGHKVTYGYDWVGDDYGGFEGGVIVPDDDPYADCSYHGTHVFGIVGADPTKFGISGVAPEASFELHRVFGCQGGIGVDLAIKASIGIYERGVDIITASIGGGAAYPDEPWSAVVSRINQNGTFYQLSAGNSGPGYNTGSGPSIGIDVPAIGAVWNTETPYYLWNGTYHSGNKIKNLTWVPGEGFDFPPTFKLWTASSVESDTINQGCGPYPSDLALPNFNNTVVLLSRPLNLLCYSLDAQAYLSSIGVKYVLFYRTYPDDPVNGPSLYEVGENISGVGWLPGAVGADLFAAYQKDKSLKVSLGSPPSYSDSVTIQQNTITGGRMTQWSSWGPTLDGRTFPTYSAPGGNILSLFPRKLGGFGQISGTSMAAPFAAGVAALLMQKHPDWDAKTVRNVLATTARPMRYNDNSSTVYDFLAPVAQQGGGLLDAYRAMFTTLVVDVSSLSFNDTAHQPKSLSFNVKNIGTSPQTLKLSHIPAASGYGISTEDRYTAATDDQREISKNLQATYATLSIHPSEVTIAPGKEQTIKVAVTQIPSLESSLLPFYGGYIALNSTDGKQSLTVPYTGIATVMYDTEMDLSGSVLVTYNTTSGNSPAVASSKSSPAVFSITYNGPGNSWVDTGAFPGFIQSINTPVLYHTYKVETLNSTNGAAIPEAVFTNAAAGDPWYLDGSDGNYTFMPEGAYRFRISVLKIYGDATKEDDWLSHVTEPFALKYTKDSVGLPGQKNHAGKHQ